jgi:molybdopterin-guanine dinucleotide biosynthesis protein A
MASCAAAILAGGRATRMAGQPKSFLSVGGERILDRQLTALRGSFDEVFVVTSDRALFEAVGVRVVPDRPCAARGPLVGIWSALAAARADRVLCVGCDMPFLPRALIELVRDCAPDAEIVVPRVGTHEEPLFARYARSLEATIERHIEAAALGVRELFPRARTVFLDEATLRAADPTLSFLTNVNTPADLQAAQRAPGERHP